MEILLDSLSCNLDQSLGMSKGFMRQSVEKKIELWEKNEIERSEIDAQIRSLQDLRLPDATIQRYLNTNLNTPFALEYAYSLLGDVSGLKVLDYGCGAGENSVLISSRGGVPIGLDISQDLVDLAEKRMHLHNYFDFEFKVGSAHNLPISDESVDVVLGIAILHHLDLTLSSKEVDRKSVV